MPYKFAFFHAVIAVFLMAVAWIVAAAAGAGDAVWIGAVFASAFYYGREVSQYQDAIAQARGVARSSLWYLGWWPPAWRDSGKTLEFLMPAAVCFAVAFFS